MRIMPGGYGGLGLRISPADCVAHSFMIWLSSSSKSPINYPRRQRKRALLIKQKNLMHKFRFGRRKIRDVERAVREVEQ